MPFGKYPMASVEKKQEPFLTHIAKTQEQQSSSDKDAGLKFVANSQQLSSTGTLQKN
jgi:hypothetical protein